MEQMTGEMSSGMLMSEQRGSFTNYTVNEDDTRIKTLEEQISKQEVSFARCVSLIRCRHIFFFSLLHFLVTNSSKTNFFLAISKKLP
jgi:hypothetical protein